MFEVHDNLLSPEVVQRIEERMRALFKTTVIMPAPYTADRQRLIGNYLDGPQRTIHMKAMFGVPRLLLDALAGKHPELGVGKVIRCKVNMQERVPLYDRALHNTPHVDQGRDIAERSTTVVYYVDDTDGDTVIFNERSKDMPLAVTEYARVQPKAGRFVVIEGDVYHTGSHPQDHDTRLVVNMNIIAK